MDVNEIALLLGRKDIEILQLQYQVVILNKELQEFKQKLQDAGDGTTSH